MPELLRERPLPVQAIAALVVPAIFGGITGWVLGVNEAAYVVLSLLGIGGGYFAGFEHEGAKAGAIRGIFGGSLFGASILGMHEAIGAEPKAHLPHPEILLVAITTAFGVGLGALGGRRRAQLEADGETGPYLDFHKLGLSDLVASIGATALVWSLWLPWFATSCDSTSPPSPSGCNPYSLFDAKPGVDRALGQFDAVEAFATLPLLLLIAAAIPAVAAWIVARGGRSSFSPGEGVMIAGIYAVGLVLLNGLILGRPGEQSVDVSLQWGYFVAIAGALAIMAGGMMRRARELQGKRNLRRSESKPQPA